MCTVLRTSLSVLLVFFILQTCSGQELSVIKRVRECLSKPAAVVCLKEEAVDVLNRTIMSEIPMKLFDLIDIEKDPNYRPNITENDLPDDMNIRNKRLNELLYHKVEEFFESRAIKFSLSNVVEGRKKKGGSKMGGMLLMGGMAMAGMMGQMMMGKIAFLAGAALLVAKMALMLAAISALKKSGGGGGGTESHVVYTASSDSGYGHSHGGWHRSLDPEVDAHSVVYAGQMPVEASSSYGV